MGNFTKAIGDRIPEQFRQELCDHVEASMAFMNIDHDSLDFMFKLWNTYVALPSDQLDPTCMNCRSKVVGSFRKVVKMWINEASGTDTGTDQSGVCKCDQ